MLKNVFLIISIGLFISLTADIYADDPEVIASLSGDLTYSCPHVTGSKSYARAFDVTGSPTVTEIQLPLQIFTQESQNPAITVKVIVEIRPDSNGQPSSTQLTMGWECPWSALGWNKIDTPTWVSLKSGDSVSLLPGRYWIVCKLTPSSTNAIVQWFCPSGNVNLYDSWYDNKTSETGGVSWNLLMDDLYFKVFGSRAAKGTTTTVTASPDRVEVSRKSAIKVTVKDEDANPASGYVTLSATGGALDSNLLYLDSDGEATTYWTAPGPLAVQTITAVFPPRQGSSGFDYNDSNAFTNVDVKIFTDARDTNTYMSLSKYTVQTHETITVSVNVVDKSAGPVVVNHGTITFCCSNGKFGSTTPVTVVNGHCSTTWTSPDVNGLFTIWAEYSGWYTGPDVNFKSSYDTNDVTVQYRDFNTVTTLTISPTFPYMSKSTYVSVEVKEAISGDRVPGGRIHLTSTPVSCPAGWFDSNDINVTTGTDYTKWNAPATNGDVTITAAYQPGQPYIAAGCRYFFSQDSQLVTVNKDFDSTGSDINWMIEWIADYSSFPPNVSIKSTQDSSQGFANTLKNVCGWGGEDHGNSGARASHLRARWFITVDNKEDDYMDKADFTWYNGHGSPGVITFTHPNGLIIKDRYFNYYEATTINLSSIEPEWGNKDAEWIAMKSCEVLSVPGDWGTTMDGLHLICGFHTPSLGGSGNFGPLFAGFMTKEKIYDEPHTIIQSWFLTGDMTQPNDRKQIVVGASYEMGDDYFWGQGPVGQDIVPDGVVVVWEHDADNNSPVANAGGPYTVTVGQPLTLDGSGSYDTDEGNTIYYKWDMDINNNTDSQDCDGDGSDDTDDDNDVSGKWGMSPAPYVFNTTGTFTIRLNIHDEVWNCDTNTTTVTVLPAPPLPAPGPHFSSAIRTSDAPVLLDGGGSGGIEIMDNFDSNTLPSEIQMPVFRMAGTNISYNQMLNIGSYYGITTGEAGLDNSGNWNMTKDGQELIINQHTGSVMYTNTNWVYRYSTVSPPPPVPPEAVAVTIANGWLAANGIPPVDVVFDGITDISYCTVAKNGRHYLSKVPFHRRVDYRRVMNVDGNNYPVVGPGGRINVLLGNGYDTGMFVKIMREAFPAEIRPLLPSNLAVQRFHDLGTKALTEESLLPFGCTSVEIDNVSLGYYEEDFVTQQDVITPVYILDLTCNDWERSKKVKVYMSAMNEPLYVDINDPCTAIDVNYGDTVNFACSVQGGTPPYSYIWSSDADGLLSTNPSFTTSSLSAKKLVDSCKCEKLPHAISVTITDSYGLTATEFVDVTVLSHCSDFDGSGKVNFEDFAEFALAWLADSGDTNYDVKFDILNDGIINLNDLCVLTGEWLQ